MIAWKDAATGGGYARTAPIDQLAGMTVDVVAILDDGYPERGLLILRTPAGEVATICANDLDSWLEEGGVDRLAVIDDRDRKAGESVARGREEEHARRFREATERWAAEQREADSVADSRGEK